MADNKPQTPLPWVVRKNPMREDGWFIDRADPTAIPNVTYSDGRPVLKWQGVSFYQIESQEDAEYIVRACNALPHLLEVCQKVVSELEDIRGLDLRDRLLNIVSTAISKAKGEI